MNVVFWSPFAGSSGVSSTMMAIALSTAIHHRTTCSIMQLQFNDNGLLNTIFQTVDRNEITYFENTGVDSLIRAANSGSISKDDVLNSSFSFIEKRLNVFSKTGGIDKRMYESDMLKAMEGVFTALNDTFKINYIDVPAGDNECAKQAMTLADLVVVCLPQSEWRVNAFFERYKLKNAFYILGNYDAKQYYNYTNILWKYRASVGISKSGVVPHCSSFADECNRSRIISYYATNDKCTSKDPNFQFISEVNKTTGKLLKACGMNGGRRV